MVCKGIEGPSLIRIVVYAEVLPALITAEMEIRGTRRDRPLGGIHNQNKSFENELPNSFKNCAGEIAGTGDFR
jgi:hypothetical protein